MTEDEINHSRELMIEEVKRYPDGKLPGLALITVGRK
jgi:hypothetical protein